MTVIRSAPLLACLQEKIRTARRDRSRHLLCPECATRTRLYALRDGRRKCSACGRKFHPEKKSDPAKLKQCADVLLCFCLPCTAQQAADMTGYHYRLVSGLYERFRSLLASRNLTPGKLRLLATVTACDRAVHDSEFCRRCRSRFGCKGRKSGESPIFGVKILQNSTVFIDPLEESEAYFRFDQPAEGGKGKYAAYAGFICRGKFHRFTDNERLKDGAERLWSWMSERLKTHHGIWKRNAGFYLKELEWKYNNRLLTSETQALKIAELLPADFLRAWDQEERIALDVDVSP